MPDLAKQVIDRLDTLGDISDEPGRLTRTFASPAMRRANDLVASWMREAGMTVREDAIGNVIGHYEATTPNGKILLLGSHLDTVRDAGKFDGALGVLVAIACVERLHRKKARLPFAIDVIGFCDEEGVRYQSAYLGSRAVAGAFDTNDLKRVDAQRISMAEAIRNFGGNPEAISSCRLHRDQLLGYIEVHIEQGPILENANLRLGIVTGVAGQSRIGVRIHGVAGHAGTVPMALRKDALCAAADFILIAEKCGRETEGLVATVGEIAALPGASNVIPGEVRLTLDLRHARDEVRAAAKARLREAANSIGAARGVRVEWQLVQEAAAVSCDPRLSSLLERALVPHQSPAMKLTSGAGHDAAVLAAITPVSMLFVRCQGGISHHPEESAKIEDVSLAIEVMNDFVSLLAGSAGGLSQR